MAKAKPTLRQIEWADLEIGVLIHYLAEIYNPDFKAYKTSAVRTELSPDKFNPSSLDPEQWVRSAYEAGAKYAILVANHCTGFSLWQTKVNDYSCASMSWKNGEGDILREFIDACKKYGLKPGVYYSTGCNGYYNINDEEKQDYTSEKYKNYVKCVEEQVKELWSEYGELFEIWFDGGIIPTEKGGPNLVPLLKKYQPNAITFQGPEDWQNNIRWVGNENGLAPENCWSSVKSGENSLSGNPDGELWRPAETDMPNRSNESFGGGWAWRANEEHFVFSPEHLLECYVNSVGRNSNLLLGMAISRDGSFEDEEQFISFGKLLKQTFSAPLVKTSGCKTRFELCLEKETELKYIVICEDISNGHNVRSFSVSADGKTVYRGECIGHKRIIPFNSLKAKNVTVQIEKYDEIPVIKSAELF